MTVENKRTVPRPLDRPRPSSAPSRPATVPPRQETHLDILPHSPKQVKSKTRDLSLPFFF